MSGEPLKILWLSTSNDNRANLAEGARRPELMAKMLEAEISHAVTLVTKPIWPSEELPEIIEKWLEREQPDIVWFSTAAYWFTYESVPLRLKNRFGRVGEKVSGAGITAGKDPRFANSATFRLVRRALQLTIGGDTQLTPEQVVERQTKNARTIARHEHIVLILEGPRGRTNFSASKRSAARAERKRLFVHRKLRDLAAELRAGYCGSDETLRAVVGEFRTQKDKFHMDETGHETSAALDFPTLLEAVKNAGLDSLSDSFRGKLRR
ncbi:MAG: hypothetical protein AB7N24_02095 [Dehalococcoidia bacterium]